MAEVGLGDCPILAMELFDSYVRPVLSYGAEVWGPQLILHALRGKAADACERIHLEFLRRLTGVAESCPTLTLLAETGRLPLAVQWVQQTARFLNKLLACDETRLAKQALLDNVALAASGASAGRGRQCWAAEVGSILTLLGGPDLCYGDLPDSVDADELSQRATVLHIARYTNTESVMVSRYQEEIRGGPVTWEAYTPAGYLQQVTDRRCRVTVARVRTGCCWLAEDQGRTRGVPRDSRGCPHCGAQVETREHAFFECPLYADLRSVYCDLFSPGITVSRFLSGPQQQRTAQFIESCRQRAVGLGGGQ